MAHAPDTAVQGRDESATETPHAVKDRLRDAIERELTAAVADPRDADGALMFTDA